MTVIALFSNSGSCGRSPTEPTDYVKGLYGALTDKQKNQRKELLKDITKLRERNSNHQQIRMLEAELKNIHGKKRSPPAEVLNDNYEVVEKVLPMVPFKHKYVSGVIAHAPEDTQTLLDNPYIEKEWREQFEKICFAGLPREDWLIAWGRHTHEGNIENHFVVPRINLRTGRAFNPAPPGHEHDFNVLRDYLNFKYNLASPLDISRRLTKLISKDTKNHSFRKQVNEVMLLAVNEKKVSNQQDILNYLNHEIVKDALSIDELWISKRLCSY